MILPEPTRLALDVREASALPPLVPKAEALERLLADYTRGHAAQDGPLVVALVGATGAGKSTLLNALAGEGVAQEGVDRPTTRGAVVYAPEGADLEALSHKAAKVARYRLRPGAPWAGQIFIDTPDVNSVETENREQARRLLDEADVALVVMHKGSIAEAAQADFLADFAQRRRLVWVVNFADQLAASSREELKAQVKALAQTRYGLPSDEVQVFALSARMAQSGEDASGELPAFFYALGRFAQKATAEKVRRSNAAAVLRDLKAQVTSALEATESGLADVRRELLKGLSQAQASLGEDFTLRLSLSAGHLAGEVRRQASARGWGPAAWWMRLSFAGGGGVAAATLLARQSLPMGLAVGAVSAALDQVREATRARAAERRVVEAEASDEDGALGQAARAALAGARIAAHRMRLSPAAAGLLEAEALLADWAEARARAWHYTEAGAVASAVGRWWGWARFTVVPLINLPWLGLFGHVAYRVARAYLTGQYLGVDYYLNAVALGAVLATLGGILASLSLAGATARAKAEGRRRFDGEMEQLSTRLLSLTDEALRLPREAARRVAALPVGDFKAP